MNQSIAPDGNGTTGSPGMPPPDIDYEPIDMDVDSLQSLAKALKAQADNVGNAASDIRSQMPDQSSGERGDNAAVVPVGGGDQDLTLHQYGIKNAQRMTDLNKFMENVEMSLRNLGKFATAISGEFGDKDSLNGADINRIKEIMASGKPANPAQEA